MVLTVVVSNDRIRCGVYSNSALNVSFQVAADLSRTKDEYLALFHGILYAHGISPDDISAAILASVVPPLTDVVAAAIQAITKTAPMLVGPGIKTGLNIRIENPAQLGSDIVALTVGGSAKYSAPIVLIDLGVATTVSVINSTGEFLGTIIAPGVRLSLAALSSAAANLPDVSLGKPRSLIGKNTVDSMQSGAVYGAAAMIDGLIERIVRDQSCPQNPKIIATGELAPLIAAHCAHKLEINPDLMLDGLYTLYLKNTCIAPAKRGSSKEEQS